MTEDTIKQRYLTTKEASKFLGISPGTLNNWRSLYNDKGILKGPGWSKDEATGQVRYDIKDLVMYMERNKVS